MVTEPAPSAASIYGVDSESSTNPSIDGEDSDESIGDAGHVNSDTGYASIGDTVNSISDAEATKDQWYSDTASFFNLEVAPLLVPLQRRLQTFGAFYFVATFLFLGISTLILLVNKICSRTQTCIEH